MKYEVLGKGGPAEVAVLTPRLQPVEAKRHYYDPYLSQYDKEVILCDLHISRGKKKTPVGEIKEYLSELLPHLLDMNIKLLVVTQPEYFKVLTKQAKTDATIGDVLDTVVDGLQATYCPNYSRIFYDPEKTRSRIGLCYRGVDRWAKGDTSKVGADVIKFKAHPSTVAEISNWLDTLINMDCDLTCDIEGFDLKHTRAGIGTITFCWDEGSGISFEVDNCQTKEENAEIRALLKQFFIDFKRSMKYHNICYDAYVLIYQLFMDHILDQEGMLYGLEVMLRNFDCTQLITYLATNTCAGNELGLKAQAQEFAGNYAVEEINDITRIPLPDLLTYNLVDGLSTWYVYNKHWPTLVADNQRDIYEHLFKPAVIDIIQMQLTGLPVNMDKVIALDKLLKSEQQQLIQKMGENQIVRGFVDCLCQEALDAKNLKLKTKVVGWEDLGTTKDLTIAFNPQSAPQLQRLLYGEDFLGLPVLDYTDSKLPATGAETLEKLIAQGPGQDVVEFLELLMEYKASAIILNTFLPAFLKAERGPDGWHYLFGNFRLGGTLSGRLSSNNPNLQNIPSSAGAPLKKRLAKLIKECFEAPEGWIFCGLDFDSLEDRISALTTRDPEKLKVYTDGYDGHSLRAYSYFGENMPDIDPRSVDSINSIAKKYKQYRQDSKAPTFALTYQGTYMTLMNNCGFSKELAMAIETAYQKMYKVSVKWVQDRLEQATKDGYVTVAFGLRVRTPLLAQSILGTKATPKEVEAEGRTAGNAMGQSYCLLNNRAASEFMGKVRKSEYRLDIKPCAHIHDAQYYLVRDAGFGPLMYMNKHLPKAVAWQDDPEIYHDKVKLSGSVEIFHPNWNHGFDIPANCNEETIIKKIKDHMDDLKQKGIAA